MQTIKEAIEVAGGVNVVAKALNLSERAIYKWLEKNSLPRSEYTSETSYAKQISDLTDGLLTKDQILKVGHPNKTIPTDPPQNHVQKVAS